ncbi:MAG: tRNA uridine-5-carboxymethylaminomethyl(34) synthesis GTPase MnmE [Lachnospiraceae bacterium]|nr:tRNA uridine-5-carboxymethylaminomethyl(34) synthesis GTPase MnmE [Lachnospiraceae bacterium]
MKTDTIAAIATGMTHSGIGIIRISGNDAVLIADKLFVDKKYNPIMKQMKSHTIHYGFILDEKKEAVDEVMVSFMKGPKSFTAEDTVEINCHGGMLIMNRILELVIRAGARLAEPGEFTKRAFLNGRIDLSEAEAVMDIISSKNEMALKSSLKQLKGSVSDIIHKLRDEIIYEIAFIESALDDPEHISLDGYPEKLGQKTDDLLKRVDKLIHSADNGKLIKEGINTVIVGKPNAGKSSLLNLLVGEEKAIVTDVAGTTRDVLEESIKLHGIGLNIIDTAGIRYTEDIVEKIGVEKAKKYATDADLVIYVVDSSVDFDESDMEILELIQDKKCIVLLNKTDLEPKVTEEDLKSKIKEDTVIIKTSTKEITGMEEFEETVKNMFFSGEVTANEEIYITNMRHKECLLDAYESLKQVKRSLMDDMPEDFYSIDLMSAYTSLGFIIGEEVDDDLMQEIFSKFCMGK